MNNADSIRKRLNEVKEMDNCREALSSLADIQYDIGMSACKERKELQGEVQRLRAVIIGNGDPENSVLTRLCRVEGNLEEIGTGIKDIKLLLQGDLKDSDSVGLLDRVRQNTKSLKAINKVVWAAALILIAEIVATLLGLI
jgi:hypothetical protein